MRTYRHPTTGKVIARIVVGSLLMGGCTAGDEAVNTGQSATTEGSNSAETVPWAEGLRTKEGPISILGAGVATLAPARSTSSEIVQSKNLLVRDLDRSSDSRITIESKATYIQALAGDSDDDSIAVLVSSCNASTFIDDIVCGRISYGVLVAERNKEISVAPRLLPVNDGQRYRDVAIHSGAITSIRIFMAEAMGDGSFSNRDPIPKITIEVVRSWSGKDFDVVSTRQTSNLEPCLTSDGTAWDLDADSGAVMQLAPDAADWKAVDGLVVKPLSSISCGTDRVAVLDPLARQAHLVSAMGVVHPLATPDWFWPSAQDAIPNVLQRIIIDPVTGRATSLIPDSATGGSEILVWDEDRTNYSLTYLPQTVSATRTIADGALWNSGDGPEPSITRVQGR